MNQASVRTYQSIDQVPTEAWDRVAGPDGFCHSTGYLRAIEHSSVLEGHYIHRYMSYHRADGAMVAHAGFTFLPVNLDLFLEKGSLLADLCRNTRKLMGGFLRVHMVECGSLTALGRPYSLAEDISAEERRGFLRALLVEMEKMAQEKRASFIVIRDFTREQCEQFSDFRQWGLHTVPNLEDTELEIRWSTYEGYLAELKAHYRRNIRDDFKKAQRVGLRKQLVDDFSPHCARMAALWQQTNDQASAYQREILGEDYFRNINQCMPGRVKASLFWIGEELVAFVLYFIDETSIYPCYIGIDYAHNQAAALVFNTYHDMIQCGINWKKRRIQLGNTAYVTKYRLGAKAVPLEMYTKYKWNFLSPMIASIFRATTPLQEKQSFNVFRNAAHPQAKGKKESIGEAVAPGLNVKS